MNIYFCSSISTQGSLTIQVYCCRIHKIFPLLQFSLVYTPGYSFPHMGKSYQMIFISVFNKKSTTVKTSFDAKSFQILNIENNCVTQQCLIMKKTEVYSYVLCMYI